VEPTSSNLDSTLGKLVVERGLATPADLERLTAKLKSSSDGSDPSHRSLSTLLVADKQISLDRMVAIKILPQKFTSNEDFVARFYAEGKAAAKLNHPNIVQAIDVNRSGEYHYFVMEFVDGRTVYDDITANGPYGRRRVQPDQARGHGPGPRRQRPRSR